MHNPLSHDTKTPSIAGMSSSNMHWIELKIANISSFQITEPKQIFCLFQVRIKKNRKTQRKLLLGGTRSVLSLELRNHSERLLPDKEVVRNLLKWNIHTISSLHNFKQTRPDRSGNLRRWWQPSIPPSSEREQDEIECRNAQIPIKDANLGLESRSMPVVVVRLPMLKRCCYNLCRGFFPRRTGL